MASRILRETASKRIRAYAGGRLALALLASFSLCCGTSGSAGVAAASPSCDRPDASAAQPSEPSGDKADVRALGVSPDDGPDIVPAEDIGRTLTRNIDIAPKQTADGYAVPEASNHISLHTILFDLDSARLRPKAQRQLDEVARAMKFDELKDYRLLVEGHTCDRGAFEHNQGLSGRRAQAVRHYLVHEQLIDADRLDTKGWGETRPVVPNIDEPHRERNRRVDFVKLESADMTVITRGLRTPTTTTRGLDGDRFLKVDFLGCKKGTHEPFPLRGKAELYSGDLFQAKFHVLEGCHVYALFLGSNGQVDWLRIDAPSEHDWLFPTQTGDRPQYGVWCYYGGEHHLPAESQYYVLDSNTGAEVLCIVATHAPLSHPEALPGILRQHGAALSASDVREATASEVAEVNLLALDHR